MKNTPQNKPSNNKKPRKVKMSHLIVGDMLGGNMSRMLLKTQGITLSEFLDGLHGWVKPPGRETK
jgi:hypothetical protein